MKIGILTYHRVINDGSVLQAYCLQQLIQKKCPGATVEIIDLSSKKGRYTEFKKTIVKGFPFLRKSAIVKKRSVDLFVRNNLSLSKASVCTDNLMKATAFLQKQMYDVVIVGSDTVWEARISPYVAEAPNIYYLPNVKGVKKISFAASSDPIRSNFLNVTNLSLLAENIGDFDHITVRDSATARYLESIGVGSDKIRFIADPTILWEFKEIVPQTPLPRERKIVGLSIGSGAQESIVSLFKNLGYSILDFNRLTLDGKPLLEAKKSVLHRLSLYRSIDFMISDRFHSSIFSFKLNGAIPTVFIETHEKWPSPNSKGRDLFNRLSIPELIFRPDEDVSFDEKAYNYACSFWQDKGEESVKMNLLRLRVQGLEEVDRMLKVVFQ